MKLLKKMMALLFCVILVTCSCSALAENETAAAATGEVIYALVNVQLHRNWALSTYGVTVYFDGIEITHLGQGDPLTFGAYMMRDQVHTLRFKADKAGVPDRCWTVSNLQNGSVLSCEIQSKRNQVRINDYSVSVDDHVVVSVEPDTASRVQTYGTMVIWGLKILQAAQGGSSGN